jgi:branched-chain amino acid transport system permease protein
MVLFAALTLARLAEVMPMVLAIAATVAIMIALAYAIELLVLRHLVNQEGIILFMATLGIANFLEGFGQTLWGSDIYKIDLGLPRDPIFLFESVFPGGLLVDPTELIAAVICAVLVAVLAVFFQVTRIGRALRAVADDHQAAQSVGIPLDYIWLIVWAVAGIVALVGGMMWGVKLGVQFSLAQIALKALPVLILGGFTSIPGAIVGGLIIGAGEKLAEVLLGPVLVRTFDLAGGGIENWFAYMLALLFLLVRPQGLFGERIIERV